MSGPLDAGRRGARAVTVLLPVPRRPKLSRWTFRRARAALVAVGFADVIEGRARV